MSMQDPISDLLTRIRNAQMMHKTNVSIPASKLKVSILKVLEQEGFILGFDVVEEKKPTINVHLKYYEGEPVIANIKRVSKPGLRIYQSVKDLGKVLGGLGISVLSTSKGVMSDHQARKVGLGGEVLCTVE